MLQLGEKVRLSKEFYEKHKDFFIERGVEPNEVFTVYQRNLLRMEFRVVNDKHDLTFQETHFERVKITGGKTK